MTHFTPLASTVGGLLIGLSASLLVLFNGRIAGISGVLGRALAPPDGERGWRLLFLAGLLAGGAAPRSIGPLIFAGLLVGVGTRLGGGCTSGHGVCGIARLSPRSIAATLVFMTAGAATVFVARHVLGGAS